jgi:hypothetical protein
VPLPGAIDVAPAMSLQVLPSGDVCHCTVGAMPLDSTEAWKLAVCVATAVVSLGWLSTVMALTSNEPISQAGPCGRATPRWVGGQAACVVAGVGRGASVAQRQQHRAEARIAAVADRREHGTQLGIVQDVVVQDRVQAHLGLDSDAGNPPRGDVVSLRQVDVRARPRTVEIFARVDRTAVDLAVEVQDGIGEADRTGVVDGAAQAPVPVGTGAPVGPGVVAQGAVAQGDDGAGRGVDAAAATAGRARAHGREVPRNAGVLERRGGVDVQPAAERPGATHALGPWPMIRLPMMVERRTVRVPAPAEMPPPLPPSSAFATPPTLPDGSSPASLFSIVLSSMVSVPRLAMPPPDEGAP